MNTAHKILAATDFSSPARHALDRAARLARSTGAPLQLVHALSDGALRQLRQLLGLGSMVEQDLIEQTRQSLESAADELRVAYGVAVQTTLVHGAVLDEITQLADAADVALVVLGARGAGFMRRFVLGSTAERLLRKTHSPMLVVKQRGHEPYRRVLVAVDFSPATAPLVDLARRVAPGAHLVLLTAYEVPFEGKLRFASVAEAAIEKLRVQAQQSATQQLHVLAAGAGLTADEWTPCIPRANAALAIIEHEQEQDCDLIVIGKHGQNMAEELLLGSVTKHVLAESAGDVLVSTLRRG